MSKPPQETPRSDPLIEDVRRVRAELSAQFDNDVDKLCEHLRRLESQYSERLVFSRPKQTGRAVG